MKPSIWSKRKHDAEGVGWFKGGEDISYAQNDIPRETENNNEGQPVKKMYTNENNNNAFLYNNNGAGEGVDTYFTFSFTYEFMPNQDDEVWFAHAVPSNYTQMQESLLELRNAEQHKDIMKMNILCLTLARNPSPLITITENVGTYLDYYEELRLLHQIPNIVKKAFRQKYNNAKRLDKQSEHSKGRVQRLLQAALEEEIKQFFEYNEDHLLQTSPHFAGFGHRLTQYVKDHGRKKAIVITSRVHPGEPQASHMLDGLLTYLLSKDAQELRKHFVIRIAPMLNPDGVIYGNYRCSLLGCDLNRKWDKPNRLLHPTIFYSKQLIRHMHQERKVVLYCDLHGHSRKQNAFFYGCCFKNYEQEGRVKNAQLRLIPLMCCQKNNLFRLKDCRFRMEKCKESTARVVIFKEFNIMNSFTLECSFFGKELDPNTNRQDRGDQGAAKASGPFAMMQQKKKKLIHMSVPDYQSLGTSLMQSMHNYLPSEQYKLQFLSGKILDVFYDEFIKFVPPYILKREEEKRKKLEESNMQAGAKSGAGTSSRAHYASRLASSDVVGQVSGTGPKFTRKQTMTCTSSGIGAPSIQGLRAIIAGPIGTVGYSELVASNASIKQPQTKLDAPTINQVAAETGAVGDDSSDQKPAQILSGNDTDCASSIMDHSQNREDLMEFESFMNGIQDKMRRKEEARLARQKAANKEVQPDDPRLSDAYSDSDGSSEDGMYKSKNKKKKQKKKNQQVAKMLTNVEKAINKKKTGQDGHQPQTQQVGNQKESQKNKGNRFSRKGRSPRQLDAVGPVLAPRKQVVPMRNDNLAFMNSGPNNANTQQIQNLIWSQLSSGVLNQAEILNEISRAILHNQTLAVPTQTQPTLAPGQQLGPDQAPQMFIHSSGQTLSDPKSRASQLLASSMPQRGIPDSRVSHQLTDITRTSANFPPEEQQRRLQVPLQARAGERNIANAIYENAVAAAHASSGSYKAHNRSSKLSAHSSQPVKEDPRSKYQATNSLNQSMARHEGLSALPEILANPSSRMGQQQQNNAKTPNSQSWGQKKGQNPGAYGPSGCISSEYPTRGQDQGLMPASSPPGGQRLPKERQDATTQEQSFRIEVKLQARPNYMGIEDDRAALSQVESLVQHDSNLRAREEGHNDRQTFFQMTTGTLDHEPVATAFQDHQERTAPLDTSLTSKPQKLRRDFIISRTGSTHKKRDGIVRQSSTFEEENEDSRTHQESEAQRMLDIGTDRARGPASRGGPAMAAAKNVMQIPGAKNQREQLPVDLQGVGMGSTDQRKDFKRQSLLHSIANPKKIKPVLGLKSYENAESIQNEGFKNMMQVGTTELQHHQQVFGDTENSSEGQFQIHERAPIGASGQRARQWKVQKLGSSNAMDALTNLASQTLVASGSHQNQGLSQSIKVQELQKYHQKRGAPITESTLTAPPTNATEQQLPMHPHSNLLSNNHPNQQWVQEVDSKTQIKLQLAKDLGIKGNSRGVLGRTGNSEGRQAGPDHRQTLRAEGSSWYYTGLGGIESINMSEKFAPEKMNEEAWRREAGPRHVTEEYMQTQPQGKTNPAYRDPAAETMGQPVHNGKNGPSNYATTSGLALRAGRRQVYQRSSIETTTAERANQLRTSQYYTQPKKDTPKQAQALLTPASPDVKHQIVTKDYRDQISKESASLDMVYKQKQLQIQLERQQQLLQQLQQQLQQHQYKSQPPQANFLKSTDACKIGTGVPQLSRDQINFNVVHHAEDRQRQMMQQSVVASAAVSQELLIPNVAEDQGPIKPMKQADWQARASNHQYANVLLHHDDRGSRGLQHKPFSNETVSRQLYCNSDSVENLDAPVRPSINADYQDKQAQPPQMGPILRSNNGMRQKHQEAPKLSSQRSLRKKAHDFGVVGVGHGHNSAVGGEQAHYKIGPEQMQPLHSSAQNGPAGRPGQAEESSDWTAAQAAIFGNKGLAHAPRTPSLAQHKVQREALLMHSTPDFFVAEQQPRFMHNTSNHRAEGLAMVNDGGHLQPEPALSPEQKQKYEHRGGQAAYQSMLPPQSYERLGSLGSLDNGSSKPQGEGVSVANYVQNINVFVTESSQSLRGTGPQNFGFGIGHGIAGGLGSGIGQAMGSGIPAKSGGDAAGYLPINPAQNPQGHHQYVDMQNHQQHRQVAFTNQDDRRGHREALAKTGIAGPGLNNFKEGPPTESGSYGLMPSSYKHQTTRNLQVGGKSAAYQPRISKILDKAQQHILPQYSTGSSQPKLKLGQVVVEDGHHGAGPLDGPGHFSPDPVGSRPSMAFTSANEYQFRERPQQYQTMSSSVPSAPADLQGGGRPSYPGRRGQQL